MDVRVRPTRANDIMRRPATLDTEDQPGLHRQVHNLRRREEVRLEPKIVESIIVIMLAKTTSHVAICSISSSHLGYHHPVRQP